MGWQGQAACRNGIDPELFFAEEGLVSGRTMDPARSCCKECPVAKDCLGEAMNHDIQYGIWGGLLTKERNRIRYAWKRP